jgi:DNA-binding GntR family transcriptional regulator
MVNLLIERDVDGLSGLIKQHLEESKETCLQAVQERKNSKE